MVIVTCVHVLAPGQAACTDKDFDGLFRSDCAYVVQVASESDDAGKLYLWIGKGVSKKARQRASKQAAEVASTMQITPEIVREQQGEESADFSQLWSSLRYGDASNNIHTTSTDEQELPEQVEAPPAAEEIAEEARENGAVVLEEKQAVADQDVQEPPKDGAASEDTDTPLKESAPASDHASKPAPAGDPATTAKEPSSPKAGESQIHNFADKQPAPIEAQAKQGVEEPGSAVVSPPSKQLVTPKVQQTSSEKVESVAKTRELLTKRLSGSFSPHTHQGKSASGSSTPKASATTYLADAAKVWGTPLSAENSGSNVAELKFVPLKDTFPYEELKGMRSDSGIDMTRKEDYLAAEEFAKVFGKERDAFKSQPLWRQHQAKKLVGLF